MLISLIIPNPSLTKAKAAAASDQLIWLRAEQREMDGQCSHGEISCHIIFHA
jgi:hypothetical protein